MAKYYETLFHEANSPKSLSNFKIQSIFLYCLSLDDLFFIKDWLHCHVFLTVGISEACFDQHKQEYNGEEFAAKNGKNPADINIPQHKLPASSSISS